MCESPPALFRLLYGFVRNHHMLSYCGGRVGKLKWTRWQRGFLDDAVSATGPVQAFEEHLVACGVVVGWSLDDGIVASLSRSCAPQGGRNKSCPT